ncbi:TasA family protein [Caproiciproducens sp.]
MKFKTKILTSVLAVGLTVALIGGSTMAWFTDSKEVKGATFQAGTVRLSDASGELTLEGFAQQNINPGDEFNGSLTIINEGTKPVKLRIKIPAISWLDGEEPTDLSTNNVKVFLPANWEKHSDGYLYYTGTISGYSQGVIPGTLDDGTEFPAGTLEQRTISFAFTGVFDGDLTTNAYQGMILNMGPSSVEVIQATNSAAWTTTPVPPAIAPVPAA